MMKAKHLTNPGKKKCICDNDLPNTTHAPPIISQITGKEICPHCRVDKFLRILIK